MDLRIKSGAGGRLQGLTRSSWVFPVSGCLPIAGGSRNHLGAIVTRTHPPRASLFSPGELSSKPASLHGSRSPNFQPLPDRPQSSETSPALMYSKRSASSPPPHSLSFYLRLSVSLLSSSFYLIASFSFWGFPSPWFCFALVSNRAAPSWFYNDPPMRQCLQLRDGSRNRMKVILLESKPRNISLVAEHADTKWKVMSHSFVCGFLQ